MSERRSEFVKRSERRIWRITAVSVLAIVGMTLALLAVLQNSNTVSRLSADEDCLRSVVAANSARSSVLSKLGKQRTDADNLRQAWNTAEQRAFQEALHAHSKAAMRKVRADFTRALHGYLRADAKYRRLNTAYNQAAQAHPVPKLNCDARQLDQPVPVVTQTTTAPAPRPSTVLRTSHVPGPVRTTRIPVPGPTVTRPGPVRIRTTTVPPGHQHKHRS